MHAVPRANVSQPLPNFFVLAGQKVLYLTQYTLGGSIETAHARLLEVLQAPAVLKHLQSLLNNLRPVDQAFSVNCKRSRVGGAMAATTCP